MSGYWPYPHPRQSEQHHLRADQHPAQRNRYDGHEQQSMPVVHYNNGLTDVHMWWMVVTQRQQQSQFHPPHQMGYHHGLPAPPYPMLSVPSSRWPVPDPRIYARRPGYGDGDARRRQDRQLATAIPPPPNDPISPSPLRLPPTQAEVVRGPKKEGGTPRGEHGRHSRIHRCAFAAAQMMATSAYSGSSPRPTPADRQMMGNGRRPASPRRRIRTPKSCPVARVEPPESSARPGLLQHPSCWTVGRSSRPPIDESETLTNSMHKRRRVSRTEYLRLPVFSEDERDDAAKAGGQQQHSARKGLSFTDMLIEHRRKSTASSFFTPERSEARRKDNKLQASASRTPAPTRRLSVIEEAAEASARHTPEKQRGVGSPTPRGLRTQLSPPLTDPRSWYDGERTPSSPSLPRINPADYGCGVPEDDTGFTTDVERGIAGEEDIGNSSSDEDDEEETSERSDEESSGGEGSTSEFEIVQRGDEIVRRKRRKKKERAKDLDFIDRSEEFNTGLFATADEPTLRFKKVVTRRFGAKLRGHPMFREDVQRQEQENGEHVVEYQM